MRQNRVYQWSDESLNPQRRIQQAFLLKEEHMIPQFGIHDSPAADRKDWTPNTKKSMPLESATCNQNNRQR